MTASHDRILSPLVQTRTIGSLRVHAIQAGGQQLDGGAMFGVVPKTLWQRRIPADERNRIPLGMRCLLIEHPTGLVLIDTGAGNKEDAKFHDIYGIENAEPTVRTALEDGLAQLGVRPEDVALVINTHLHFDHAGGNSYLDASTVLFGSPFPKRATSCSAASSSLPPIRTSGPPRATSSETSSRRERPASWS